MPTYEYGCSSCGKEWEEVQRITEPPLEVCPQCGKTTAHRLISSGGGFILKGGGWYSDLYSSAKGASKTEDSGKSSPPADAGASKADKPDATKTEAKPAAATTTPSTAPAS